MGNNGFYIKEDGTIVRNNYNNSSKPPKKSKGGVWAIVIILIIAAIVGGFVLYEEMSYSPYSNTPNYRTAIVNANGGLRIREYPDANSNKLVVVPNGSVIHIIEDNYKENFIDASSGYWVKVRYGNIVGFVWKNYLIME